VVNRHCDIPHDIQPSETKVYFPFLLTSSSHEVIMQAEVARESSQHAYRRRSCPLRGSLFCVLVRGILQFAAVRGEKVWRCPLHPPMSESTAIFKVVVLRLIELQNNMLRFTVSRRIFVRRNRRWAGSSKRKILLGAARNSSHKPNDDFLLEFP